MHPFSGTLPPSLGPSLPPCVLLFGPKEWVFHHHNSDLLGLHCLLQKLLDVVIVFHCSSSSKPVLWCGLFHWVSLLRIWWFQLVSMVLLCWVSMVQGCMFVGFFLYLWRSLKGSILNILDFHCGFFVVIIEQGKLKMPCFLACNYPFSIVFFWFCADLFLICLGALIMMQVKLQGRHWLQGGKLFVVLVYRWLQMVVFSMGTMEIFTSCRIKFISTSLTMFLNTFNLLMEYLFNANYVAGGFR